MLKNIQYIILSIFITLPFLLNGQNINLYAGSINRHSDIRSKYLQSRNIDVWLPEGYNKKKRYAVLYMHDGQMLYDASHTWNQQEWKVDETISKLLNEDKIKDVIVVGIWNNNQFRHAEYFPEAVYNKIKNQATENIDNHLYAKVLGLFQEKINSDNYLKFIVKELKPFIDKKYSTYTDASHTFMAGSSMGGLISMYALCEYPEVFGGVACLSTHWPGVLVSEEDVVAREILNYLEENIPATGYHKIYMDIGTMTLDSVYEPYQSKVDQLMVKKGFTTGKWWVSEIFEGADHSEKSWAARLDSPLLFLLGK